ncbi:MAG: FtsQ-type POTRA domain-containing protein [bacterium]
MQTKKTSRVREERRRALILKVVLSVIGLIILVVVSAVISNLSTFRIAEYEINGLEGVNAQAVQIDAKTPLIGTYFWFWPRDCYFYLSTTAVEDNLLALIPRIQKVNVSRSGFKTLQINIVERKPSGLWCANKDTDKCYFLDNEGLVFDRAPALSGQLFVKYLGLLDSSIEPLGQRYLTKESFSTLTDFMSWVLASGVSVGNVTIDADGFYRLHLPGGGEIFVSDRQDVDRTFRNLQTLLKEKGLLSKTVSFDTNLDYIDLRFGEKVYIKKK